MITRPVHLNPDFYFTNYVNSAKGDDLIKSLQLADEELLSILDNLSEEQGDYAYAEGKWTIKQLVQHMSDTDRIISYRALRFARKDFTILPGFEEDDYADNDNSKNLTLAEIKQEFIQVRKSTQMLFKGLSNESLDFKGSGNGFEVTPRLLGWVLAGHVMHHVNILKERYLS